MTVEGPCESSLRTNHQSQISVHPAPSWGSVVPTAARGEFVEPDRCCQISLGHERAKRTTDRVTRIQAFCSVRDVRFVCAEIVKTLSRCSVPKVRDRRDIRHIAAADRLEFLQSRYRNVRPVAMKIQISFGGTRSVGEW